jgi:pilus assembly protein Flp/PilA
VSAGAKFNPRQRRKSDADRALRCLDPRRYADAASRYWAGLRSFAGARRWRNRGICINLGHVKGAGEVCVMLSKLASLVRDERGVTAMEYGLIAALMAISIVFAVGNAGSQLRDTFNALAAELQKANAGSVAAH